MVSPIYLIAVPLLVAFLLGVLDRLSRPLSLALTLGVLAWMTVLSALWFSGLTAGTLSSAEVLTAGFDPPLSINLRMGLLEAGATLVINLAMLGSAVVLLKRLRSEGVGAQVLLLMMAMGANGIVLTRDLFNLFVFLEISAIATYGIIALEDEGRTLAAGFKYIIAGGIASALLLLGTGFLYRITGTLNIDGMAAVLDESAAVVASGVGLSAAFLVIAAVLIELKVFPINGWALDVYETAHPAVSAGISAGTATAMIVALDKTLVLMPQSIVSLIAAVGFIGFAASNLIGLRQTNVRRMLGYSSVAQIALVAGALAASLEAGLPRSTALLIAASIVVNHAISKAGLFWTTGALGLSTFDDVRGALRGRYGAAAITGVLVVALAGLPPFAGFFGKWHLVLGLADGASYGWIAVILLGSLFEVVYLFRFLGVGFAAPASDAEAKPAQPAARARRGAGALTVPGLAAVLLTVVGIAAAWVAGLTYVIAYVPIVAGIVGLAVDGLPARVKGVLLAGAAVGYTLFLLPIMSGIGMVYLMIVPVGSILIAIGGLYHTGRRAGVYPLLAVLITSMSVLLVAHDALSFLVGFELMTVSSYLLLLIRRQAERAALRYLTFSVGSAFLLMTGLALLLAAGGTFFSPSVPSAAVDGGPSAIAEALGFTQAGPALGGLILIALSFLVKTGAVGAHIWLPSTYGEADGETSALFSAIISKIPVLGLIVTIAALSAAYLPEAGAATAVSGDGALAALVTTRVIAWVGMLTAVFGALLAVFQEDVKYLLAYSSMSQLGYVIGAFAAATQIGWTAGLYLSLLHFAVKVMLFLALTGVIMRTGRSRFYELGGLIRRMPVTFVSVLFGIITLSGVPPLAGFGGKWLLYNAFIENGMYLPAALAFFASTIAFLYLFRLIHAVFLGQPKDELRDTREAPPALLIPQLIVLVAIMAVSMYPRIVLDPLLAAVGPYFSGTLTLEATTSTALSVLGYWNGSWVMFVTMGVFLLPLVWLVVVLPRPKRVGQFDIVYAAERPERPETTHYAHNFFAHYHRALGFLTRPGVVAWWYGVRETVVAAGAGLRRLYTGNGQTYALHILLFVAALYLILGGM